MKTYICTLLLSMAFAFAHAQTEPEFELEPYVFNLADSTLASPLPCESAYSKAKAAASLYLTGIGKVKSYYYIKGESSPLTIDKKKSNIIINTGGTSPQQTLSIIKLSNMGTKRRWKTGEAVYRSICKRRRRRGAEIQEIRQRVCHHQHGRP